MGGHYGVMGRSCAVWIQGGGDLVRPILAQFSPSLLTIVAEFFPYFVLDIKFKILLPSASPPRRESTASNTHPK